MRKLKEIKEEILTRSKRRIIRRKRIVFASVTLCVCCIVGTTAFMLKYQKTNKPEKMFDVSDNYSYLLEEDTEAVTVEVVKITYGEKEYTSKADISKICNCVSNIIELSNNRNDSVHNENDGINADDAGSQIKDAGNKKIGFYDEYGQCEELIIENGCLRSVQTGVCYSLSQKQRSDLLELLN